MRAQHSGPSHRARALTALKKEPPYQEEISCDLRADTGPALALRGWEQGQRPWALRDMDVPRGGGALGAPLLNC